jgi:hypothetical protein
VAKHGWDAADITATQVALHFSPIAKGGRLEYTGPEYSQNGVLCKRRVVVAPDALDDEPSAKEIVTSYGRYVGPSQ